VHLIFAKYLIELSLKSVGIVMMFGFDIEADLVGLYFVMRLFVIRL
jgi:hypothetical protein